MGHLDHATFGWLTPALSYAMASIQAALGPRCTVRALDTSGRSRRNWLITAASAIGTGIWTMHFVAMLGFGVTGTDIRYDVPLTLFSLLVAMVMVGAGVFAVGYGRGRTRALLIGGLTTGLGVAGMHYIGMAALRLHGSIRYDPLPGARTYGAQDVSRALDLDQGTPVVLCDARDRESGKEVLIRMVEYAGRMHTARLLDSVG
ncbi:hypothetical protein F0344_00775 [Streptomyces finlayi]|uniref:MHYT domain-containing protein n=1 Tax=Streptomyces finlayi TaxID=67296 RepID=A0A7G7BDD5_9ACTN|nr:hypothetical protein F0344_00775 [Streptomyces finlayi]